MARFPAHKGVETTSIFARIHKTLRITSAMAAGISDKVGSYEQIA